MKRQTQLAGVRRWYGDDLLELQSEPFKALDGIFGKYGPCIISGCDVIHNGNKYDVSSGLVALQGTGPDGATERMVIPFAGATSVVLPIYLSLAYETTTGQYDDGEVKPVSYGYYAKVTSVVPEGEHIPITASGGTRYVDVIQDAGHRFITDSERTVWNDKETPAGAQAKANAALASAKSYTDVREETFSSWVTTQLAGKQATIKNVYISNFNSFNPSTLGLAEGEFCTFNHYSGTLTTGRPSMGTGMNQAANNPLGGIYGWSGTVTRICGTYYMVTAYGQNTITGRPQMATRVYDNKANYDWVLSTEYASKSSSGYVKLPSGMMIQWGALGRDATGTQYTTVYFPISFSSAPYFVTGCLSVNKDLTAVEALQYDTLSVSSMTVARRAARDGSTGYSGQGVLWIALGTWK